MQNALYRNVDYLIHKRITYVKTFVQVMSEQMLLSDFRFYSACHRHIAFAI
jgi:hypothetical protein